MKTMALKISLMFILLMVMPTPSVRIPESNKVDRVSISKAKADSLELQFLQIDVKVIKSEINMIDSEINLIVKRKK